MTSLLHCQSRDMTEEQSRVGAEYITYQATATAAFTLVRLKKFYDIFN